MELTSEIQKLQKAKITNMAKQKIGQEIYSQYYSALEKGCIDKFSENYLRGDIFGTMRNNVLKVSDILEACIITHFIFMVCLFLAFLLLLYHHVPL